MGSNQTNVEIRITPTSGDHPAHIHLGTCANLNPAPEFPLSNVVNGTSTTVINQALSTIQGTQRAINLHLSAAQAATYVACGDIPLLGTQPPNAPPPAAAPAPAPAPPAPAPQAVAPAAVQPTPSQLPRTGDLGTGPLVIISGLGLITLGLGIRRRATRR
jgi:hypothetical protein